ncbi:MAG: hypothetical protein ACF8XB_18395 [Planctomycetota bacterium JB042]
MTVTVDRCLFEGNHDGIETSSGWLPRIDVTNSTFDGEENGMELPSGLIDGQDSTLRLCRARNPNDGGVGDAVNGYLSTSGIGLRGDREPGSTLTVRRTLFDENQIAVNVLTDFDVVDLGTDLGANRGDNTFVTDITSPWDSVNPIYNRSYCCVSNLAELQLDAVGNTWTYDASGLTTGWNQGVDANGSYDFLVAFFLPPGMPFPYVFQDPVNGVNYFPGVLPIGGPNPRPIISDGIPNVPWNICVGPDPDSSTPALFPSIRVK